MKSEYVGIDIKTEKAQEQDDFGNKMKYHFHITTLHKYTQLKVKAKHKEALLMYGKWYFILLPKPSWFLCFFGFDINPYILFHF